MCVALFPGEILGQAEVDLQLASGKALVGLPPAQHGHVNLLYCVYVHQENAKHKQMAMVREKQAVNGTREQQDEEKYHI